VREPYPTWPRLALVTAAGSGLASIRASLQGFLCFFNTLTLFPPHWTACRIAPSGRPLPLCTWLSLLGRQAPFGPRFPPRRERFNCPHPLTLLKHARAQPSSSSSSCWTRQRPRSEPRVWPTGYFVSVGSPEGAGARARSCLRRSLIVL